MKNFLQTILAKVKNFFTKAEDKTKAITLIAIKLTEAVKVVWDSPVKDVGLSLVKMAIPGTADDVLIDKLAGIVDKFLPTSLLTLKMVNSIANIEDKNEQFITILKLFKLSGDIEKNAAYHDFCSKVIYALADGKLTWAECVYLAQSGYEDFQLGQLK
jgi:hypothetical protein